MVCGVGGGTQEVCYLPGESSKGAFSSEKVGGRKEGVWLVHNGRGWGKGRGAFSSSRCSPWHPSPSMAALALTVLLWAPLDSGGDEAYRGQDRLRSVYPIIPSS